jgi:hypothetical protein
LEFLAVPDPKKLIFTVYRPGAKDLVNVFENVTFPDPFLTLELIEPTTTPDAFTKSTRIVPAAFFLFDFTDDFTVKALFRFTEDSLPDQVTVEDLYLAAGLTANTCEEYVYGANVSTKFP